MHGGSISTGGSTGSNFWHRTCPWCGRGGNLHLDSADPNCRCQQDSVLITSMSLLGPSAPQDASFNTGNYQHPPSKVKKSRGIKERSKNKRNAISVTPNYQTILESPNDNVSCASGSGDNVSPSPTSDRPISPASGELLARQEKIAATAVKSRRVRQPVVVPNNHIPPDNVFSPQQHHNHQQQQYLQSSQPFPSQSSSQNSGWQMLMTSQCQPLNGLYPYYGRSPGSKVMHGSTCTNRIKSIIAQKSATGSIAKLWSNLPSQNSYAWYTPLSVVAQRRLNKMYLK